MDEPRFEFPLRDLLGVGAQGVGAVFVAFSLVRSLYQPSGQGILLGLLLIVVGHRIQPFQVRERTPGAMRAKLVLLGALLLAIGLLLVFRH